MTVSLTTTKHVYNGDGVTVNWPYTFPIIASTDIVVYKTATTGEVSLISTGYTVNTGSNTVTYPNAGSPLAVGEKVTLIRQVPLTQLTDYQNSGAFNAETLESALDKVTLIGQQLDEALDRCVKFPVDETPTADDTEEFLSDIQASESAAATSASNAATSASAASTSASAAATSATAASTSATNAATSATSASGSASTATTQATNAATSATSASTSATNAAASATSASGSATTATTQATNASNSASAASTSATNASNSATAAATSATNAATSATAAAGSATAAAASAATIDVATINASIATKVTKTGDETITGVKTFSGQVVAKGTATNDSASAGYIGEYVSSTVGNTNTGATTAYGDLTSISLTAGDWDVTAFAAWDVGTSTWTAALIGITTTSGNSNTGISLGDTAVSNVFASSSSTPAQLTQMLTRRMSVSATTTVYFKFRATFSAGQPVCAGRLSARRVR